MNSVKGETSFTANITAARGRGNILPPHVDGWGGGVARIPYTIEEETDEEKAKVVVAVWGTEFLQFHVALHI